MKVSLFVSAALMPLGLLAAPSAEAEIDARAIVRPQYCTIVGSSSTVNCRSGPGTKYDVVRALRKGTTYDFWCVWSKECVTIGGSTNCGWHYLRDLKCFVNGHYTSSACTMARLGSCATLDDDYAADPF